MNKLLSTISRGLVLWVLLGAGTAYLWPHVFEWTGWPLEYLLGGFLLENEPTPPSSRFDLLGQKAVAWMFAVTMFAVGTVTEPRNFAYLARHPLSVLLGLLTQFTVMPGLAWLTASLGGFRADVALGFIIVGCAPGAVTSNVLTYLAGGDTAYSVTLTTLASIVAVFLTPLLVLLLAGAEMGVTMEKFWDQLWTIAWTIAFPLILGLTLRIIKPSWRDIYASIGPAVAVVAIVLICCFVVHWTRDQLGEASLEVFLGVVVINALGFALGGLLARLYRLTAAQRITLSIEVGMQNAGMGVVLAATTFSKRPDVAIPSALFTLWCIVTAAALIALFRRRRQRQEWGSV